MMIQEFEQRTGFFPAPSMYAAIELAYLDFDGDKDAFCEAYKANAEGLAEQIQREAYLATIRKEQERDRALGERAAEIERLKKELEREQEWKPYERKGNIPQADYEHLAKGVSGGVAHYITDEEALDWVCGEFGFERSQVTILHEVDAYEINRHNRLRKALGKLDRRPIYCATDYHYIRFDTGRGRWQWEAWGGQIRPFLD